MGPSAAWFYEDQLRFHRNNNNNNNNNMPALNARDAGYCYQCSRCPSVCLSRSLTVRCIRAAFAKALWPLVALNALLYEALDAAGRLLQNLAAAYAPHGIALDFAGK